jgi:phage tail sheath protein FI
MPITPTYPGVYIEEISSGVRTIVGVATSVTAFIGRAKTGAVNRAKTINTYGDFEREFGGLWADSSLGYAVRDFYLNGGSQAIIVRLFHPFFATEAEREEAFEAAQSVADAANTAADAVSANATAAAQSVVDAIDAAVEAEGATPEAIAIAARGAADDEANADEPRATAAGRVAAAAEAAAEAAGATPASVRDAAIGAVEEAIATSLSTPAAVSAVIDAVTAAAAAADSAAPSLTAANTMSEAATRAAALAGATSESVREAVVQTVGIAAPLTKANLSVNGLSLQAANEGAWGNQLQARIDHEVIGTEAAILFNLSVRDGSTGNVEVFRNVTVQPNHPRNVEQVLKNTSSLVRVSGALSESRPTAHAPVPPGRNIWQNNTPATHSRVDVTDQSSDGSPLILADFNGSGLQTNKQGLYALEQADLFNLLCIPPYRTDNNIDTDLITEAVTYCESRRAMLILDPPSEWTTKDSAKGDGTTTGVADLDTTSSYAALFFPRLRQPNPLKDNQIEDFAPCGAIAGVFARTDAQRGVWKAPAGLDASLRGVPDFSVSLTDPENGELNPLGVNCLRVFPGAGRVVWGARTMAGDDRLASEWKYIPVRRLALFIEESLFRGLKWVVFEPNDEPLWAQIRLNVGAFMQNLFRQGAFQGKTAREAYLVKCDRETTTQNDINLGIVNIVVGFAPLKPAEFVILKLQQLAGQIEV